MVPTKNNSKRVQVDKDKTTIFAIVSVAAFITVASLMVARGLWSQTAYLSKVADKKEVAVKQLEANKSAVVTLEESYKKFKEQTPNLLGGSIEGASEKDGDNAKLILDSLPSKYDFPALTTSIERLLVGYGINGITGVDDTVAQQTTDPAIGVVEIPFSVDVYSNYEGIKELINSLHKSIRPFQVTKLEFRGTNDRLQAFISAKTFYQPERGLEITEEPVQ